jgi:phage tail sheath protein FI
MPEYLSPEVYVEELPSANRPIQAVGTSTGAFVGFASKGFVGVPRLVGNTAEFLEHFGGRVTGAFLAPSVELFFQNGGTRCYVVRTASGGAAGAPATSTSDFDLQQTGVGTALTLTAATRNWVDGTLTPNPGTWGDRISFQVEHDSGDVTRFTLRVSYAGETRIYGDPSPVAPPAVPPPFPPPGTLAQIIQSVNDDAWVVQASVGVAGAVRPDETTAPVNLTGGGNGTASPANDDFTGITGLGAFDIVDDINIVSVPDSSARDVMRRGINYCERRGDCFFVAHAGQLEDAAATALNFKQASGPLYPLQSPLNSSFGALYVPWIEVNDGRRALQVPPDGAVAGRYSATDVRRGVHKAPGGTEDGRLRNVLRLRRRLSVDESAILNPNGINALREFRGVGRVIWGVRTLSSDPALRYVSVRRFLLMIEESIAESTKWVVFEPNTQALWRKIERIVRDFLRVQWRNGALFGASENQAFFVKCDEENNPVESRRLGRVITEVGVAIVKPAEFVIFRIQQSPGGFDVSE